MTFESLQPMPFCFEKSSVKKMDILMFKQRFERELSWDKVKYARITITHVYCILQSTDELLTNGDSAKASSLSPPNLPLQRYTHNGDYIPCNHGDWSVHAGGYQTLGRQESQSHTGVPPISSYISKFCVC